MATSGNGGASSGGRDMEARLRDIAAGKRPAIPYLGQGCNTPPEAPLTLLDQAIELLSSTRHVRQRLLDDLNSSIHGSEGMGQNGAEGSPHPGARPATPGNPVTPGPAMPTRQFQEMLNGPWFNTVHRPTAVPVHSVHTGANMPVRTIQHGRSFLKMFQRPLKPFMALPRWFGETIRQELLPAVQLIGDTTLPFAVAVHEMKGRLYFTHGWEQFVLAERIHPDDVGLFIMDGPHKMQVRLYYRSGLEKPFNTRPAGVDPDVAPPAGPNIHVPSHILGMEFELGPKVSMTPGIMQQLANVWATRVCNNPLYVCVVINSHIRKKALYFGTKFSAMLPQAQRLPAAVFFGDSNDVIRGAITKSARDDLARLSSGFGSLVKMHGIALGDTLVVRMREVDGGYRVRIFKVPA